MAATRRRRRARARRPGHPVLPRGPADRPAAAREDDVDPVGRRRSLPRVRRARNASSTPPRTAITPARNGSNRSKLLDHSPLRRLLPGAPLERLARRSRWRTGSVLGITASGDKSGHGFTLDVALIDEAFAQVDDRLVQAFRPAMVTRRDAQLWILSTAGTETSVFLRERVEDGRARVEAGERAGVAYFEWSAPDDAAIDDPATWRAAMPALGLTIDEETIGADLATMDEGEFARAYLNRWAPRGYPCSRSPIGSTASTPARGSAGALGFGVDVAPDRRARDDRGGRRASRRAGARRGRRPARRVPSGSPAGSASSSSDGDRWRVRSIPASPAGSLRDRPSPMRPPAASCCAPAAPVRAGVRRVLRRRARPADRASRATRPRRCRGRRAEAIAGRRVGMGAHARRRRPAPLIAATLARWAWSTSPPSQPRHLLASSGGATTASDRDTLARRCQLLRRRARRAAACSRDANAAGVGSRPFGIDLGGQIQWAVDRRLGAADYLGVPAVGRARALIISLDRGARTGRLARRHRDGRSAAVVDSPGARRSRGTNGSRNRRRS